MIFIVKGVRRCISEVRNRIRALYLDPYSIQLYQKRVELFNQEANDYIRELLLSRKPCMISKFGTIELAALANYRISYTGKRTFLVWANYFLGRRLSLGWGYNLKALCTNAGFFPDEYSLLPRFYEVNLAAIKEIDVLGSYVYDEIEFEEDLSSCKRVNLDGFYAPFYWHSPWTSVLKDKRVLVIHPFSEDIQKQYARRRLLWKDEKVLPDFELITYKSVQSISGTKTEYKTWFDALQKMESDISQIEFDIALIGCGAYGMPLAASIKKMGKQAIHLAGWTQVLFGIIGKRWEDNPETAKYINEYWVRPSKENVPENAKQVEGGCYW